MRAVTRLALALLAGAFAFGPATALAQQTAPPPGNTAAADAVGPSALRNFSLGGTVTKPAEPAPQQAPVTARRPQPASPTAESSVAEQARVPAPEQPRKQVASNAAAAASKSQPIPSEVAVAQPASGASDKPATVPVLATPASAPAAASTTFPPDPQTPAARGSHGFPLLPWLLAGIALAGAAGFLFWRNRSREAFAGVPQVDAFVAPEPAPASAPPSRPAAAPPPPQSTAPRPQPAGVISTRLRPWVEIGFQPLRCILDEEKVTLEFDLELFNSGSAPARAVLAEATLLNAGAQQEQEIGRFFANPIGKGERIAVIPPLQRFAVKTQVFMPREQLVSYEIGGRQVFVPVIVFNVLYDRSGAEGQTSAAYLLGRDTKREKLAPFRLDLGPHIFRGLAARLLPDGVRQ